MTGSGSLVLYAFGCIESRARPWDTVYEDEFFPPKFTAPVHCEVMRSLAILPSHIFLWNAGDYAGN